ncbi:sugar ABC transporter ATP-binding protein [uncultured Tessaracoccus sp.]|uniref:sugar ABC transporter ATP-binding protein n=1 Tax=uncultured Tessaracoccus sp. TaxID=905023 RepID=UPI002631FB8A|nr:sugar ABC transporter ATP-binding protein [uncultured Tessaracoccus sp.]
MTEDSIIQMRNISKRFGGVHALKDVSLDVRRGEVHALIGENGAGKSTLMKILAGAYMKDSGTITIDGEQVEPSSPRDILDRGVSVIYQEFMLAPDLTVAENIFIDTLGSKKSIFINWRELNRQAAEQLERLGFGQIRPTTTVRDLSVGYQQIVEISKSIARNSKIIVFDEPTAVLTHNETQVLLELIRKLRDEGVTILYISHRLEELFAIADRITVLKDGAYVDTVNVDDITQAQLVKLMVGRDIMQMFPERHAEIGDELLKVEGLCAGDRIHDVSFNVRRGEVVGFSGLVGSGRTETMRALFGADRRTGGTVIWKGKEIAPKNPRAAIRMGIGLLPEDRKSQGLVLPEPIRINSTLVSQVGDGFINAKKERAFVTELLDSLTTKYGKVDDPVNSLSGGNQQKVSLAKWLAVDTELIILDEPTRGVDVGAKVEIYRLINQLAEAGVGVIVISSEMIEIIGICDRTIVMRDGAIAGEVAKEDLTEDNLIKLSMGV